MQSQRRMSVPILLYGSGLEIPVFSFPKGVAATSDIGEKFTSSTSICTEYINHSILIRRWVLRVRSVWLHLQFRFVKSPNAIFSCETTCLYPEN